MPSYFIVYRQDDNGNRFPVHTCATEEQAQQLVDEMTAKAHKQVYWWEKDAGDSIRWYKWSEDLCGWPGWVEIDEAGWTTRQIEGPCSEKYPPCPEHSEDRWYLSSWGDGWGDQISTQSDLVAGIEAGDLEQISQAEFNALWEEALASRREEWTALKGRLSFGQTLDGKVKAIWGEVGKVAVDLGEPFLGVLCYDEYCTLNQTAAVSLRTGLDMELVIDGFDDEYQWVLLRLEHEPDEANAASSQ